MIAEKTGVEIVPALEHHRLVDGWSNLLDEGANQTLNDHGVQDLARLRLECRLLAIQNKGKHIFARFDIDPALETVDSLKKKIQVELACRHKVTIPPKHQRLFYGDQELLDSHQKLSNYNVQIDSTLQLQETTCMYPGKMQIFVRTLAGKQIPLFVHRSDNITEIKGRISLSEGIPADQQRLLLTNVVCMSLVKIVMCRCRNKPSD